MEPLILSGFTALKKKKRDTVTLPAQAWLCSTLLCPSKVILEREDETIQKVRWPAEEGEGEG